MAYCTLDDILKKIPVGTFLQLSDDSGLVTPEALSIALAGGDMSGFADDIQDATAKVQEKSAEAIEGADAEVDGYCATRYTVPLVPVLPIIVKLSADLAIYNLYSRVVESIPETRQKQRDAAVKLLERIADGRVLLDSTGIKPPTTSKGQPLVTSGSRLFTREEMRGL